MRHLVRVNTAGKVVCILAGVAIASDPQERIALRALALINAVCMLGGTLCYSRFWDTPTAIEAFLSEHEDHALSHSPLKPAGVLFVVSLYYYTFAALFVWQATRPTSRLGQPYAVSVATWHFWCAAMLTLAAALRWWDPAAYDARLVVQGLLEKRTDSHRVPSATISERVGNCVVKAPLSMFDTPTPPQSDAVAASQFVPFRMPTL